MSSAYDEAVSSLYGTPHETFVSERQRLAADLKGAGDKASAARLSKLPRPSLSAWAVNQLWRHARPAFDQLFETARGVRRGERAASAAHREAVSKLTTRAKQLLEASEHAGGDATLRRISMTLSALAAAGGFEPEQAGMLTKDRDPPGFEAFGIPSADESEPSSPALREPPPAKHEPGKPDPAEAKRRAEIEKERERELEREAAAEKQRAALRAKRAAELSELEGTLRAAKAALVALERDRERAEKALKSAEHEVERARASVVDAEARLADHASEAP